MDFNSNLFPSAVLWLAHACFAVTLVMALYSAPWARLRDSEQLHVFLGACVCLLLLWSIRAGISPGLTFHLLGVTTLTLMFGWQFAYISVTLVVIGSTYNGIGEWNSVPLNATLMGAVPIAVTQVLLILARLHLPKNIFIYIFINAFLAAGIGTVMVGLVTTLLMIGSGIYSFDELAYGYLPYFPLISFPEAIINGILITVFTVYRHHWIASFDDEEYLGGPHSSH